MRFVAMGCVLLLAGCASQAPKTTLGILTVAVVGNDVMVGREHPESYTFDLASLTRRSLRCSGYFEQRSGSGGMIYYHCTDGSQGNLRFYIDGPFRGRGTGVSSRGPVQFLFGYSVAAVNAQLNLPGGSKLEERNGRYVLRRGHAKESH